ncbi:hypothetical protein Ga0100231_005310 [Opitutaceae bacterium TAV4]|nr:hypothetical protein Ga0100231_023395 [Opitutaceae bacterium TAV4]RRJ97872.1 hypothetical protein Ga0100231_005310 [Opitutaceae bacterium TAV4]RRK02412.1 hypothetical protein Ga0100230_004510 [Opitutaceae bacterium TAV3]
MSITKNKIRPDTPIQPATPPRRRRYEAADELVAFFVRWVLWAIAVACICGGVAWAVCTVLAALPGIACLLVAWGLIYFARRV